MAQFFVKIILPFILWSIALTSTLSGATSPPLITGDARQEAAQKIVTRIMASIKEDFLDALKEIGRSNKTLANDLCEEASTLSLLDGDFMQRVSPDLSQNFKRILLTDSDSAKAVYTTLVTYAKKDFLEEERRIATQWKDIEAFMPNVARLQEWRQTRRQAIRNLADPMTAALYSALFTPSKTSSYCTFSKPQDAAFPAFLRHDCVANALELLKKEAEFSVLFQDLTSQRTHPSKATPAQLSCWRKTLQHIVLTLIDTNISHDIQNVGRPVCRQHARSIRLQATENLKQNFSNLEKRAWKSVREVKRATDSTAQDLFGQSCQALKNPFPNLDNIIQEIAKKFCQEAAKALPQFTAQKEAILRSVRVPHQNPEDKQIWKDFTQKNTFVHAIKALEKRAQDRTHLIAQMESYVTNDVTFWARQHARGSRPCPSYIALIHDHPLLKKFLLNVRTYRHNAQEHLGYLVGQCLKNGIIF